MRSLVTSTLTLTGPACHGWGSFYGLEAKAVQPSPCRRHPTLALPHIPAGCDTAAVHLPITVTVHRTVHWGHQLPAGVQTHLPWGGREAGGGGLATQGGSIAAVHPAVKVSALLTCRSTTIQRERWDQANTAVQGGMRGLEPGRRFQWTLAAGSCGLHMVVVDITASVGSTEKFLMRFIWKTNETGEGYVVLSVNSKTRTSEGCLYNTLSHSCNTSAGVSGQNTQKVKQNTGFKLN